MNLPDFEYNSVWVRIAAAVGYMVWEYWLGKSDRVAGGSTLELIQNGLAGILKAIFNKNPTPGGPK